MMEPINILANQRHVGCLGGGQLGRMMAQAASRLGVIMTTLDPGGLDSPMGAVCGKAVTGSFTDPVKIRELAKLVDVVTVEIEHVDAVVLAELEAEGIAVHPSGKTIMLIQDKYAQKIHLSKLGGAVPLGDFCEIPDVAALLSAGERWGYPIMLKAKKNAYDGRGNLPVGSAVEAASAFATLSNNGKEELYAERWCLFTKELAVMVARSASGVTVSYPVVEMTAIDSQLHTVLVPASIDEAALALASKIASAAIASLSGGGIFGVELFLMPDGSVLLNEIAPRPHNSGHYTMDSCHTDQFEMHLRCVLDLPLGSAEMKARARRRTLPRPVTALCPPCARRRSSSLTFPSPLDLPRASVAGACGRDAQRDRISRRLAPQDARVGAARAHDAQRLNPLVWQEPSESETQDGAHQCHGHELSRSSRDAVHPPRARGPNPGRAARWHHHGLGLGPAHHARSRRDP
jgi:phosphoribosylaminoimidazole carboxylase PurK protein